ncbi:MAG: ArsR/SmtB family transcription factor [Candidatus Thorarchaeota archaeon]|jgi:DNA-binding transcriptional ArsR family regulator
MTKLMKILSDPVRARIFLEAMIHREITVKHLLPQLSVGSSTISHHLKRLVEEGVLDVRVEATGRPVKYYTVSDRYLRPAKDDMFDKGDWLAQRASWLEHAIVQLQAITNVAEVAAKRLKIVLSIRNNHDIDIPKSLTILETSPKFFMLHHINERDAEVWLKEHRKFVERFEKKMSTGDDPTHLAFSGLLPIVRYRD